MLRYGSSLKSNLPKDRIKWHEIFPAPVLHRLCLGSKWKKWGGYVDKYLLFPRKLSAFCRKSIHALDVIHVIDHSNAVYLNQVSAHSRTPKLITCHDLIAIETAMGRFPQAPKSKATGRRLQKWIEGSLPLADFHACVSSRTQRNLHRVVPPSAGRTKVILNGVSLDACVGPAEIPSELPFDLEVSDYLLHVGSDAWYKNRATVLRAFRNFCDLNGDSSLKMVFVGPAIQKTEASREELEWISKNRHRVIALSCVSEDHLRSLYRHALSFLFPSFVEGFGWPPIEATARGCPVITTKTGAIDEILGDSAIYVDPNNQQNVTQALSKILGRRRRKNLVPRIPTEEECASQYADLYGQLKDGHNS